MLYDSSDSRLSVSDSHFCNLDKTLLCWNGFIWSFGNSLVCTTLLVYILFELVDKSEFHWFFLTMATLTALPKIVGGLSFLAPQFLRKNSNLSRKAALFYGLSGLTLCFVPLPILFRNVFPIHWLIVALIVLWTVHHLYEYFGNIAVDCMVGELIPENHRGKYYASRSRYMLVGAIGAAVIAFLMKDLPLPVEHHLFWAWCGAGIIILSTIPLLFCTQRTKVRIENTDQFVKLDNSIPTNSSWFETLFSPLRYFVFWQILFYGIAFSFINGLTQTTQYEYSVHELGISFEFSLFLMALCRIGQWCLNWIVGPWSDRAIRPTLMISQGIVAFSLLFLGIASKEFYYVPIVLSWVCLSGYAGLNVGIPKYLQTLSQTTGNRPANFALYNALSGVAFAISVILSGYLLDYFGGFYHLKTLVICGRSFFAFILMLGFVLKLFLVLVLGLTIKESDK